MDSTKRASAVRMGLLRLTLSKYSRRLSRPVTTICATRKDSEPKALAVLSSAYTLSPAMAAQQEAAGQRIEGLRAEAAELEGRIAALKASAGQAEEARRAGAQMERRSPQIVECLRGAVILQDRKSVV